MKTYKEFVLEAKLSTAERLSKKLKKSGYDPDAALKRSEETKKKLDADEERYIKMGILKPRNEEVSPPSGELKKACWKGYTAIGMKKKNGKMVPNCVPKK